jgi:co-chaperonin GroES (HSP10)
MFHSHKINGQFRPLQDWVILKPVKEKERVRSGVVLPERVEDYGRCEVVAVGPGTRTSLGYLIPTELKVGQFVYIQKFVEGEMKFTLNGALVYAIRERHLNCTIEDVLDRPPRKSKAA